MIFVRHAQSNGNAGIKEEGFHPDDPRLTPLGEKQAQLFANRFSEGDIDCIISSSLLRTCQSVEPTAKKLGLKVKIMRELMEVNTGVPNASSEQIKFFAPSSYDGIVKISKEDMIFPLLNQTAEQCEARAK